MISQQRPLSIAYYILSLTNSALLTANIDLFCTKNLYLIHVSHSPFHRKMYIHLLVQCHLCPIWPPVLPLNLTYILIFSFATVMSEPALHATSYIPFSLAWVVYPKNVSKSEAFYDIYQLYDILYSIRGENKCYRSFLLLIYFLCMLVSTKWLILLEKSNFQSLGNCLIELRYIMAHGLSTSSRSYPYWHFSCSYFVTYSYLFTISNVVCSYVWVTWHYWRLPNTSTVKTSYNLDLRGFLI
jgi:hypothetical protein